MGDSVLRSMLTLDMASGCSLDLGDKGRSSCEQMQYSISFPSHTETQIKAEPGEDGKREDAVNFSRAECLQTEAVFVQCRAPVPRPTKVDEPVFNHKSRAAEMAAIPFVLGKDGCISSCGQLPCDTSCPTDTRIHIKVEPVEDSVREGIGDSPLAVCTPGDDMVVKSHACVTEDVVRVKEEDETPEQLQCELPVKVEPGRGEAVTNMVHHMENGSATSQSSMCTWSRAIGDEPTATASDTSSYLENVDLPEELFMSDNEVELLERDDAILEIMRDLHTWPCLLCGRKFKRPSRLRRHMVIHSSERKFKCNICGAGFKVNSTLKTHLLTHSLDKPFKCDMCVSTHCTRRALLTHVERKHGPCERRFMCDVCGSTFLSKSYLEQHLERHRGKNVLCMVCGSLFYTESNLKTHMTKFHDLSYKKRETEKFECAYCASVYSDKNPLKIHILTVHLKETPFECSVCGIKFAVKHKLDQHMMCHTRERKFKCNCGQGFSTKAGLERHSLTHVNYRPYTCDMCGLTFTQKSSVERHITVNMRGYFKRYGVCKPIRGGRGGYYVS